MSVTSSLTLFRIVVSDPPTERDFWSHKRLGRRYDLRNERIASGVSMYDREQDARRTAVKFPATGTYIAELRIPDNAAVVISQTVSRHHYTVWANPELLITFVVRVVAV